MRTLALFCVVLLCGGCATGPSVQRADVKIVRTVASWPYQKDMVIDAFDVRVVEAHLNLFNDLALVEYDITGRMTGSNRWKPFIRSLFVSQRVTDDGKAGDFEVIPVVSVKKVAGYLGGEEHFHIIVQEVVQSLQWGPIRYDVRCGGRSSVFTLIQQK